MRLSSVWYKGVWHSAGIPALLTTPPHHPLHHPLHPSPLLPTTPKRDIITLKDSPYYVYKPLQDLPITQKIISDHFLQKLFSGQNRPKVGI